MRDGFYNWLKSRYDLFDEVVHPSYKKLEGDLILDGVESLKNAFNPQKSQSPCSHVVPIKYKLIVLQFPHDIKDDIIIR